MAVILIFGAMSLVPRPVARAYTSVFETAQLQIARHQGLVAERAPESLPELDLAATELGAGQGAGGSGAGEAPSSALYSLEQFIASGVVNWSGYRFTYYSQQVLPGTGLAIPGRHVNAGGYVSDGDGFIVLAGSAPKGTVYETPFGYRGKVYDRGTFGNHLDVYIR